MPLHDWTRVDRFLFHNFYLDWVVRISGRLNTGVLPSAYYALSENLHDAHPPGFLELPEPADDYKDPGQPGENRSRWESPPTTWLHIACDQPEYAEKVITIRRCDDHHVVAAVRVMAPDGKRSRYRLAASVQWAVGVIRSGIHLLIVDLFPPGPHDPLGLPKAVLCAISSHSNAENRRENEGSEQ